MMFIALVVSFVADDVTAMAISATSFSVTWTHTGENDTEFVVTFTSYGGSDDGMLTNVESGVEVTGRTPGEEYTVTVISQLNGLDAPSNDTSVRLRKSPNLLFSLQSFLN